MKYLLRISAFLRPYLWQTALNLLTMFVVTGLSLVVPRLIQGVIDQGLLPGQTTFLANSASSAISPSGLLPTSATTCATGCTTTCSTCRSASTTIHRPAS